MRGRLIILSLLNIFLIIALLFVLNAVGILNIHFGKTTTLHPDEVSQDPFLMEKDSLHKQWAVLTAKEVDLEQRQKEFDKNAQIFQEKQKAVNAQLDKLEGQEKQQSQSRKNSDETAIRNLAQKVGNIPPASGASILNNMDPVIAVETIQMMDKIAAENGAKSSSAYLISLMDPAKQKEVVRLLSAYPSSMGNLNIPIPPGQEDSSTATPPSN